MANKKISELNINTSPTYSDALPIVNSGTTKQITLSGITDFLSNTSLKFPEAPIDGNQYARENGNWTVVSGFTTPNLQQVTDVNNSTSKGIFIDNPLGQYFLGTEYIGGAPRFLVTSTGDGTEFPGTNSVLIQADLNEWINISSTDGTSSTNISNTPLQARISKNIGSTAYTLNVDENGIGIQTNGNLGYLKTDNLAFSRTYQLPDNHGTLALLSDIPPSSSPNLQDVTDVSHFTNNPVTSIITLGGGRNSKVELDATKGMVVSTNGSLVPGNPESVIKSDNLTVNRELQLPDNNGTIALLSDISGSSSNLQSVIETGNMAEFNSGNTSTRLPNESDHSISISSTNTNSGNNEFYTLFGAEGNFITQVGDYNSDNPSYGDRTFQMNEEKISLRNYTYFLPEDEDLTSGVIEVGGDYLDLTVNKYVEGKK